MDIGLSIPIYELDLMNFHLIAEGDFSVDDDRWVYGGELAYERLMSTVHQVVTCCSVDPNLTVDIVDMMG